MSKGPAGTLRLGKFVRRYTTLSSALDTLAKQRITLLAPTKWDDTNDAAFMELYRSAKGIGSVLAACCTMSSETYHHWRVFTEGMEGVCIEFDRLTLSKSLKQDPSISVGGVEYVRVQDLEKMRTTAVNRLPFIKRVGFSDEREWRVLVECSEAAKQTYNVPIDLSSISRIILNPWLPQPLADNLRRMIRSIPDCTDLKIEASKLTNSPRWKAAGRKLAGLDTLVT